MIGDLSNLFNLLDISPCSVGLLDGSNIVSTKEGSITLDSDFCLGNVLYVPELSCNLISMSQLIDR